MALNTPPLPTRPPFPVWKPSSNSSEIPINKYRSQINRKFNLRLADSQELHKWSVTQPQDFWIDLWSYVRLIPDLPSQIVQAYDPNIPMADIPRWFEGVSINYAENVLTQPALNDTATALIGLREGQGLEGEVWSWADLRENVRQVRSALMRSGVRKGDRVAAVISTSVWSVALFLGAASIGAIFTSIAPDLGEEGCISRLRQVTPSVLFADSHRTYKGKKHSNEAKVANIVKELSCRVEVFLIPLTEDRSTSFPPLSQFLSRSSISDQLEYARVSFNDPLYILYSSGTTGPPKCLVHRHGAILQHKKIGILHNSLVPGEVVFQYSSTSWVLWNIMVGHLSVGATLILYDGSPTWPSPDAMLDIVEKFNVNYWGCSPRYLQALEATKVSIRHRNDLSSLRMVQSGGSHLAADQYHWFYLNFPPRVHLTSVTGGTDLVTSWIGTDPAGPLYAGELQLPILGHDVDIADPLTGESIKQTGESGEFICRQPFPSMPISMWGDGGDEKYRASYFERFGYTCWAQHDWASYNAHTKGWTVHGRSDGVLNPQGIRFGSAEIYSVTEAQGFSDIISTTLCVGRRRKNMDSDESVFLFVVMCPGEAFSRNLVSRLKQAIRGALSSRHVPRFIVAVNEIPMTVNGKKVETLVKEVICTGKLPKVVSSTVSNPQCLEDFKRFFSVEERASKL